MSFFIFTEDMRECNKFVKYRNIDPIHIKCELSTEILEQIFMNQLCKSCKLAAFGYDKLGDKYWGKKTDTKCCSLYFVLSITYIDSNISLITIEPIIGNNTEIKTVLNGIKNITNCTFSKKV